MADNFDGQVNVSGNQSNNINSGIFSTIQHKQTQQQLNQTIFGNNGLSQVVQQEAKVMIKTMEDMLKTNDKLKKSQQTTLNNIIRDSKNSLAEISKISSINETSLTKFENVTKNTYNNTLKYYELQQKILQDELTLLEQKKKKSDEDKARIIEIREEYDQIANSMILARDTLDQTVDKLDEAGNTLKSTTKSWSEGMSETLDSVSSTLGSLANMFNINKLANSGLNQFVSTKLDLQNQMMKDFGMTSKNEYLDFKNNLDDTLNSMGNLFNSSDLKTYMGNLSKMGITDTNLAESMAKSSMLASKYLGVSTETQQQLFKYMKRTNDYDMLDEHNKTITGILQAQLGVSREQLDIMSQEALANMDALAAAGVSAEVQGTFRNQYVAMEAALTNSIGEDAAKSIMGVVSEFANSDLTNASSLVKKYGANAVNMLQSLQNTGDVNSFVQTLISSAGNRGIISSNATENKTLQSILGIDASTQAAINSLIGNTEYQENFTRAFENRNLSNPSAFVENTTELTSVDKISNMLDKFINGIDWNGFTTIVTAATAAQIASGTFDIISKIGKLDFKSLFSNTKTSAGMLKNLGTAGKGLLAAGGGIFLGVSAANMISNAIESSYNKTKSAEISAASSALNGTDLEGNASAATALGISNATSQRSGLGTMFSTVTRGLGTATLGWTRDLATINQDDWKFMQEALAARKSMTDEEKQRYITAWELLLISAGRQTDIPDFANVSKSELTSFMQSKGWSKELMDRTVAGFNGTMTYPNKSLDENQEFIDWTKLNLDGYHKAGKNYIPKDNYHALLHKGEMVLDSEAADAYRKGIGGLRDLNASWPSYSSGKHHSGNDYNFPLGTPVGAAMSGTVAQIKNGVPNQPRGVPDPKGSYGNRVYIDGDNGLRYIYAHLTQAQVSPGQRVEYAQQIGLSGNSGNTTGPHLHFEVRQGGTDINPTPYATDGLFQIGATSGALPISNISSENNIDGSAFNPSSNTSSRPIISKRILPSAALSSNGVGGADLISSSVDSGINKIINYLNTVRNEQDTQREMLNTFSKANTVSSISG